MTPFVPDQWIMLALIFLLGLLVGMFLMAGSRWKRRYREQAQRSAALETENERLRDEAREMESLRHAATKAPGPDPTITRGEGGPL